jgi:hypothetical protein
MWADHPSRDPTRWVLLIGDTTQIVLQFRVAIRAFGSKPLKINENRIFGLQNMFKKK